MDKSLPANLEAERATLGSCLLNREAVIAIAPWLGSDDFYGEQHAWVYEAIISCYNARVPPDIRTVSDELRRRSRLDAIGGITMLASLIDGVPTSYHVEYYARIVQRTATLRKLIGAGGKIAALGYDEQDDVDQTLNRADQVLFEVTKRVATQDYVSLSTTVDRYYERLQAMQEAVTLGPEALSGLSTGYRDLDALTGGLQRSDLIYLAARPSMGKTSLALSLAYQIAQQGVAVGVFSLEMSNEQLTERLISVDTGVSTQKLRTGRLVERDLRAVLESMGRLAGLPILLEDTAGITVNTLRHKARRMVVKDDVRLIILDYVQLLIGGKSENRTQEVSTISRELKRLARELNIPIVALSQLSRAVEGRADHRPMLSDLRESGSLEQDADIVLFIYREEKYDQDTDKQGIAEIIIAKHRNGPTGVVPLYFEAATTRFRSLSFAGTSL